MHALRFLGQVLLRTFAPVLLMACMPVLIPAIFLYRVFQHCAESARELWDETR